MRLKLAVFDVDGTLVDSQAHIVAAMARAFASEGLAAPSRAAVLGHVGLSLPSVMAGLAPGADAARIGRLVAAYREGSAALRSGGDVSPLYPGARAALGRLRARGDVVLGIATGKSRRGLCEVLEAHGIAGWFQTVHCADDHPSKPDPAMLRAALAETGADAADSVIVGDTTFDMEMGRAAGIAPLGVAWGYHGAADLASAGAVRVIGDFGALDGALARIWGAGDG